MSNLLRKYAFPIKLVFSVALLGYCVYLIDLSALRGISVKWSWMGAALILIFIGHGIGAIRFKLLLDPVRSIRLINHTKYYVWAGFFNSTLPTSIGGDAMRIVWLKHHDVSLNKSSFFVLLERLIGVATLLAIACTTALFLELPNQLAEMMWAAIKLILIGFFFLLVAVRWSRKLSVTRRSIKLLRRAIGQMSVPARIALIGLSFLYQGLTVVTMICLAVSLGIYLDWNVWFFVVPLLWLLTVLPISVGGLGVREVGLVVFLREFSQSSEQAVALGLLTFLTYLAAGAMGGIWYSVDAGRPRKKS